jgi:transglutaminase-like putative cysteine protease
MLYDVRLALSYEYESPVHGGRHLVRVSPATVPGMQRVVAASLTVSPAAGWQTGFTDFFGNSAMAISLAMPHDTLEVRLTARVLVEDIEPPADLSPTREGLAQELALYWSVQPDSPHHFIAGSPRVEIEREITAYAWRTAAHHPSVMAIASALCMAINRDFEYDSKATDVETKPSEAFALRKGVCQDFAHIMIAGLRGLGIPAAYVSGFLRTVPPPGKPRLEGADAMHAWVRVWCGQRMGWVEFDPTNAMTVSADHISVGYGRDYSDVSPIVGIVKTSGSHETAQSVDVIRVE